MSFIHSLADHLFVLMLALVASPLVSGPAPLRQLLLLDRPAILLRGVMLGIEKKLNRPHRGSATKRTRGLMVTLAFLALCYGIGGMLGEMSRHGKWGILIETGMMALLLSFRTAYDQVQEIKTLVKDQNTEKARGKVAQLPFRDRYAEDSHAIARAGIEYLSVYFCTSIVGTAFSYILFGLAGGLFYAWLAMMGSLFGNNDGARQDFMVWPARAFHVLSLIPARLSGLMLAAAAAVIPGGHPARAIQTMTREVEEFSQRPEGMAIATAAGALGISLAGPYVRQGIAVKEPWIDAGPARIGIVEMTRMQWLYIVAYAIMTISIAAVTWIL